MGAFFHFSQSERIIDMITTKHSEFYAKLQRYIFIHPDAEINPETNFPDDQDQWCVVDVDDIICNGIPITTGDGVEMTLWAMIEADEQSADMGELFPGEEI